MKLIKYYTYITQVYSYNLHYNKKITQNNARLFDISQI